MPAARKNHYVPQWYQEGFLEPGRNTLAYLDLNPTQQTLPDGRLITGRALFEAPTSRAFFQTDLYSTFFGTSVNDEIERRLFGNIEATWGGGSPTGSKNVEHGSKPSTSKDLGHIRNRSSWRGCLVEFLAQFQVAVLLSITVASERL